MAWWMEKKSPLFSLATVWLAQEMATSREWLLCDICSPFCRAIEASGLAARLAHVLVSAWAAGSLRSGCVTWALYLNFLRLGSGIHKTEPLIQTLQKSKAP